MNAYRMRWFEDHESAIIHWQSWLIDVELGKKIYIVVEIKFAINQKKLNLRVLVVSNFTFGNNFNVITIFF